MASLDTTALSAVLKQKYTQRRFNMLAYTKNPFFAMIRKDTNFGGKNKVVALRNAVPQGRGATFSTAQGNKTASVYTQFVVTRVSDYALANITGEAIRASKGNENSLIEGLTKEIDGTIHVATRSIAISMFRNGGGARGQISTGSTVASTTITLANIADIVNFEKGMVLVASAADGTSGTTRAGSVTVGAVDRDLGTITTTSGNWSAGITGLATSDYLFQQGDVLANGAGTNTGLMLKGLGGWIPSTAPAGGDSFFGVDRSVDTTRLAGVRVSGGGGPIEETLIELASRINREGGEPDTCFLNNADYSALVKALGSKVLYDRAKSFDEPDIGFKAVMLDGPAGPIKVVMDVNCPQGKAYMLQMDTWALESLGAAPGILEEDGNMILRSATADEYEVRVGYYGNMTCEAPGWNGVATL